MPAATPGDRTTAEFEREFDQVIAHLAAEAGPAPGAKPISDARKVTLWGQMDPQIDEPSLVQQLMSQGIPPEQAANLVVVQENPDLSAAFGQAAPDAVHAEALARLAKYPFRLTVLDGLEDPEERVREAERIDRAWQKSLPQKPDLTVEPDPTTAAAAPAGMGDPAQAPTTLAMPAPNAAPPSMAGTMPQPGQMDPTQMMGG